MDLSASGSTPRLEVPLLLAQFTQLWLRNELRGPFLSLRNEVPTSMLNVTFLP